MELARVVKQNLSLVTEAEVLSYTYTGTEPVEVMARVMLGSTARPISGGGLYKSLVYLNDVVLSPGSDVVVQPGRTETIIVSRALPLEEGDVVSIRAIGLPTDASVDTVTTLRDVTPTKLTDLIGGGPVQVDHNYGGTDALAVELLSGVRVDNATIRCFRSADYAAGKRSPEFMVASTTTDVNGRWTSPMMLDAGSYTLLIFKQGAIKAKVVPLIVA